VRSSSNNCYCESIILFGIEVFGVGIETALSFLIGEKAIHLNLHQQDVGGRKSSLLDLDHRDLTLEPSNLAEAHVRLLSGEILERSMTGFLEAMVEGFVKHILNFFLLEFR